MEGKVLAIGGFLVLSTPRFFVSFLIVPLKMQDEDGNRLSDTCQTCPAWGTGRLVKRIKSLISTPIPSFIPSPPSPCSDSSSFQDTPCSTLSSLGSFGSYGYFTVLPTELIFLILDFLPLSSIGFLGQTSTALRDVLVRWLDTKRMRRRLITCVLQQKTPISQSLWCGNLSLPTELFKECQQTGVVIKRLTTLFPTSQRIAMYHRLVDEVTCEVLSSDPFCQSHVLASVSGVILHSLVAGWVKEECVSVYQILCKMNNIDCLREEYENNPVASNPVVERSLRLHLRSLFLDFCARGDRSMWLDIIFASSSKSSEQTAKLLLLLYAPVMHQGGILWQFVDEDAEFTAFIDEYRQMADTLARLTSSHRYKPSNALELLDKITEVPRRWSIRALSSLLLCVFSVNPGLVNFYFKSLAANKESDLTIQLLLDVVYISNEFITSIENLEFAFINIRSVLNLIRCALNSGWSHDDRQGLVRELWGDIRDLSLQLFDDALSIGNTDELQNFLETWKDLGIHLTF